MRICGVEEAGRGPVIGPMVMCGLVVDDHKEAELKKMGARDSKLLTPAQRERLYGRILEVTQTKVVLLQPVVIDAAVGGHDGANLNWLEAETTAQILNEMKPEKAFIDCPSPNIRAYTERLQSLAPGISFVVEHKADVKFPVVSAASIIAKVTRDREVEKIKAEIGHDFGSGYMTDPLTSEFLQNHFEEFPDIFRKSWAPYRNLVHKKSQKSLGEF